MDFKYIAEPSMHSMPAVALHPNSKFAHILCDKFDAELVSLCPLVTQQAERVLFFFFSHIICYVPQITRFQSVSLADVCVEYETDSK